MKKMIIIDVPDKEIEDDMKLAVKGGTGWLENDGFWYLSSDSFVAEARELPRKRETQVLWYGEDKKPYLVTHEPSEYDKGWNDCVSFLLGECDVG